MAVSYKKQFHLMIKENISNAQLMCNARISANIITKLKDGQYIALDKVESICAALNCTPNDILEFLPTESSMRGGINDV
ncbi:MAG TPA: helix-turn-helix domain-containing protein [Candidatus Caccomorpha excrementavium]|nr:helix-turn-helix domain-containing protein [Candidatus Caccomorpha excrementavium]